MSERARNLATMVVLGVMAVAIVVLIATSPSQVDRVESIGERIKCPVCQGESIAHSPAPMARDMMALVAERVSGGHNDAAIVDELLSSYSGAVLLDPPASGTTLLLWMAPVAALAAGVVVIFWWRRHPRDPGITAEPPPAPRVTTLLILCLALAGVVVAAGFFLQERPGATAGVAAIGDQALEDVSNETMEAVIAANPDHPEVDGMRLALGERYYEAGDYRSAFPHFLAVAESPQATDAQAVTALIRLGWMAWEGNSQVDTALGLFDQALAIDEGSTTAMYLKGKVLWCGAGQARDAAGMFEGVLSDPTLDEEARPLVEADLAAVNSGAGCP